MRGFREQLEAEGVLPCAALQELEDGDRVTLAGFSIHPHRPPVPSGEIVVFLSMEDESGLAQVTVPSEVYQASGGVIVTERLLTIEGVVARRGEGNILIATTVKKGMNKVRIALLCSFSGLILPDCATVPVCRQAR